MFVSVTRLRVRSLRFLPSFFLMTTLSQRQVVRASGFLGGRLLPDRHWTFWTLTGWESERAMKSYRGTDAHAKAMPRLAHWCDEGSYAHWIHNGDSIPGWEDAYQHMLSGGKISRVNHPSADHTERHFPQPRLRPMIGQEIKPAARS